MARKRYLMLVASALFLSFVVPNCSSASLQYGDNCVEPPPPSPDNPSGRANEDTMCNERENLSCQNGVCLCKDMRRMTYDPALGVCVGLAGQECVHHPNEAHLPNFRKSHCVPYSSCENRTCTCWGAFYQDDGQCFRRRGYMQQCRMDHQCDERKGLSCSKQGLCDCDSSMSTFNADVERCVGLPDQPCVNMYRECVENYKCKVGVCKCRFKEVAGADGKLRCDSVKHKYGKNCGRNRGNCGRELACINGKCRCKNPDYQIYDYDKRVCVSLIGGPCTVLAPPSTTLVLEEDGRAMSKSKKPNKTKKKYGVYNSTTYFEEVEDSSKLIPCIPYARCLPYTSTSTDNGISEFGRCECEKGYIETKKARCNLPFGAPCDTHAKNKKDLCDEGVPLFCVQGACGCKNELDIYEDETKRCKRSIGGLCWKDASCVQTARCIRYSPRLPGRCMCPPNTQPDVASSSCVLYEADADSSIGFDEEDDIDFDK